MMQMTTETSDDELLSVGNIHAIDEGLLQKSIHKQIDKDIQKAELEDQRVRLVKRLSGLDEDIRYTFYKYYLIAIDCAIFLILCTFSQIYKPGTK